MVAAQRVFLPLRGKNAGVGHRPTKASVVHRLQAEKRCPKKSAGMPAIAGVSVGAAGSGSRETERKKRDGIGARDSALLTALTENKLLDRASAGEDADAVAEVLAKRHGTASGGRSSGSAVGGRRNAPPKGVSDKCASLCASGQDTETESRR
eukprot:2642095-Rhodomonas_salina.1